VKRNSYAIFGLAAAAMLYACAADDDAGSLVADAGTGFGGGKTGGASGRSGGSSGATSDAGAINSGGSRSGGASGTGGSISSGDGGVEVDALEPSCALFIEPVDGRPLTSRLAAPGETLSLAGRIIGTEDPTTLDWRWSVSRSGVEVAFTVSPTNPANITIPIDVAGVYQIRAMASALCQGVVAASSVSAQERRIPYFVRVLPPPEAQSLPRETLLEIGGGQPTGRDFHLEGGARIKVDPRNENGFAAPSYIRITPRASTFVTEGYSGLQGGLTRQVDALTTHDILVVPTDRLPPRNFVGLTLAAINVEAFTMSPGVSVRGTVRHNGQPVTNARLLLRQNGVPSTVGISDKSGSYAIEALSGRHGLRVEPDPDSTLPQLALSEASGLLFAANAPGVRVDLDYLTMPTAELTLSVRTPDGATPVRGAQVHLASAGPIPAVATLTVNSGSPMTVAGNVLRQLESDAFGVVRFTELPKGPLVARVLPPEGGGTTGATPVKLSVDLSGGDVDLGSVPLGTRIRVTGTLLPASRAAGIRVVARPIESESNAALPGLDPLKNTVTTVADANGQYVLSLAPNQSYRFFAYPALGKEIESPRAHLGDRAIATLPVTLSPWSLPTGIIFSGRVYDSKQQLRPGTVVQIFCVGASTNCVNFLSPNIEHALPVGEALTNAQGAYAIVLPDPASSQTP